MRGKYVAEAQEQASAMCEVLERSHPGAAERLRHDPLAELDRWDDLAVVAVPESAGVDRCSVAGSYHPAPPTLFVAQSASRRRNGFTGLHELGHHLQQTDEHLGSRTFDVSDSAAFEEEACDAFAAQILLPDAELSAALGPRGPVVQDVADLFAKSSASREACCVWAARHLRGAGAVVLLDSSGIVLFASPRSFIPPARKSDQSGTPLIAAALANRGRQVSRDETHVAYRTGHASDPLYGQAVWSGEYLFAIVVTDNAPWRELALPRPSSGTNGTAGWTCETCGDEFKVVDNCGQCGQPRCPDGHCGCDVARTATERLCTVCFLKLPPAMFAGSGTVCRDCG
ncbi:ImmA/IrrE family metallo-endopeptidase [Amycolatopsis sp. H6(2020)]|nr:ImmA/IrrE family metallo-endopeptidase [Amycolatopsis sp. H6(2020)]